MLWFCTGIMRSSPCKERQFREELSITEEESGARGRRGERRGEPAMRQATVALVVALVAAASTLPHQSWRQPSGSGSPLGVGRGGAHRGALQDEETAAPAPPRNLTIGLLVPHTNFGVREYIRAVNQAVGGLSRARGMSRRFDFMRKYNFTAANVHSTLMMLTPSPKDCYDKLEANAFPQADCSGMTTHRTKGSLAYK
ncbi:hypothetical protein FOCC_FOCC015040 [Frankliniella occidentalis]|nr:hypothetical protein FOCC_FOCC015040 [Frankliniella occidentalis]